MRKLLIVLLLGCSAAAVAYGHQWFKLSEHIVTNSYGAQVLQCTWQCQAYNHNNHTTVTQGSSAYVCPIPN